MDRKQVSAIYSKTYACILVFGLIVWMFAGLGCDQSKDVKKISLEKSAKIQTLSAPASKKESLKIDVSAMISPKETLVFYKKILAYLSQKISLPIQLVQRET